jgi:Lon protease-like protein
MTDFDPTRFSGTVPLFPLPGTVLFPHQTLPLHIFEPRYRQMVAEALEGEKLIAMALLAPGWQSQYQGRPKIHEMTCLGQIVVHERLPDGKYNLMLRGVMRAVVTEELPPDRLYRTAKVELYKDYYHREPMIDRSRRACELVLSLKKLFRHTDGDALVARLMETELPLGQLCDLLAPLLRCDAAEKQALLEEPDADQRSDQLLMAIRRELAAADQVASPVYPPAFSLN